MYEVLLKFGSGVSFLVLERNFDSAAIQYRPSIHVCRAALVFSHFVGRGVYVACVRTSRRFIFASYSQLFRCLFECGDDYFSTYFACRCL